MGLLNLGRRRKATGTPAPVSAPQERQPLTAEESADLEAAWIELQQTAGESRLTSFRACSRDGRPWAEDPETVRQISATIRRIMIDTAEGPKDSAAR
ncbi:hypothetical protein AB4Y88_00005 [Paenarthrobacter sp. RAF9]